MMLLDLAKLALGAFLLWHVWTMRHPDDMSPA
jgi:hypothetical protein